VIFLINNRICSIISVNNKYVEISRISTSLLGVLGEEEEEEKMRKGEQATNGVVI
jgi:hypothetical protein